MEDAGMSAKEIFMQTGSEPSLPLQYLIDITNNFSEKGILGRGGFGVVYKGLHNGEMVAVKKLLQEIPSSQKQFENEVNFLMELKHPNIVRLVGYCYETRHNRMHEERKSIFVWDTVGLLCLEYLPNGSLKEYISDASSGLNWHTRWKIIEGISYGLQYLHESSEPIIHLDLKPANILLDANMLPKIADFGLSRLFDQNKTIHTANATGTFGYMPHEAIHRGIITPKSDIFSLGVIIMEVITGHRDYPDIRKSSKGFLEHELKKWRHRLQEEPGYTSLDSDCQQIERCLRIGLICVHEDRTKRPTVKKIIDMLQGLESMDWYIGNEEMEKLLYDKKGLRIEGYTGALAFYNMDRVELMEISDVSHIPLSDLRRLNSLRSIHFKRCNDKVFAELNGTVVLHEVVNLHIEELQITGELFSNVLRCFPALSELSIKKCERLELLPKKDGGLLGLMMLQSFRGYDCVSYSVGGPWMK